MYEQAALTEGLVIKRPWFTIDKGFPKDEVLAMVGPKTSMIVISNPNNPTATAIPRDVIIELAEKCPQVAIMVDECYYEFMSPDSTVKDVVGRLPNLFVCRTFSKTWGMPSLRLGYLISAKANVDALCAVRGPYDVNTLARVAIIAALKDSKYVFDYVKELNEVAKPKLEDFLRRHNITFWPCSANFIFCYFKEPRKTEAELRSRKILVRPKKDAKGVEGLRVTIGTTAQTERLISALDEILAAQGNGSASVTNGSAAKKQKV